MHAWGCGMLHAKMPLWHLGSHVGVLRCAVLHCALPYPAAEILCFRGAQEGQRQQPAETPPWIVHIQHCTDSWYPLHARCVCQHQPFRVRQAGAGEVETCKL